MRPINHDAILNDLDARPHAYLFACLVDRQVPAEWCGCRKPHRGPVQRWNVRLAPEFARADTEWRIPNGACGAGSGPG